MPTPDLLLGLIGDNIARSSSPRLHRLAGAQNGLTVRYDSLIPIDLNQPFETIFARCQSGGYRGLNITYPYKERVTAFVTVDDPQVRALGAVNTVLFTAQGPKGFNTDYTGFMAAYTATRGATAPGIVGMIGTGGVGRAIAFGLLKLGTTELRLFDRDTAKAETLANELRTITTSKITVSPDAAQMALGADGLVNCTPVGMVGYGGTPLPAADMTKAAWAFDAVYTPVETQFLTDAAAAGLDIISGYELFFFQGVHAWRLFSNLDVDQPALRHALKDDTE
jgi:shikimate dehydrogenase